MIHIPNAAEIVQISTLTTQERSAMMTAHVSTLETSPTQAIRALTGSSQITSSPSLTQSILATAILELTMEIRKFSSERMVKFSQL